MAMGFSAGAIQASRDATGSTDVGVLIDWLHSHSSGAGTDGSDMRSATALHPDPRYPEPQFGRASSPLRSHPVQIFNSLDNDPAVVKAVNPYQQDQHAKSFAVPLQATGMEAIVAGQRAKASKIGQDVQSGFRDLQVCLLGAIAYCIFMRVCSSS